MVEQNDWRLSNDVEFLKNAYINPTDGEEICRYAPHLKRCEFCLEPVQNNLHQWWFVPTDLSCCICEECYNDFKEDFEWKNWTAGILSGLSDVPNVEKFYAEFFLKIMCMSVQSAECYLVKI